MDAYDFEMLKLSKKYSKQYAVNVFRLNKVSEHGFLLFSSFLFD